MDESWPKQYIYGILTRDFSRYDVEKNSLLRTLRARDF